MVGIKRLLENVLKKIEPLESEKKAEQRIAEQVIQKIRQMEGKHVEVVLAGSVARDTHLKGDRDIDIFVLFPKELSREEFEKEGLRIGKSVFRGHEWEKAYSEHPYIRGIIQGFEIEIVPSYKIKHPEEMLSSVDRSIFHNSYLLKKISEKHRKEIRLLKQFLKGIKCYGAEIGASSVPGYVAELLVLEFGSFLECLKAAREFKKGTVIDIEKHLEEKTAGEKFGHHFIVVDPTDKDRNAAAALSYQQYARLVAAARAFLEKPSIHFFFGKKTMPWKIEKVREMLSKTELAAIIMPYPKKALPDIVQGQLKRLRKKIAKQLELKEFRVKRSEDWTDEKELCAIIIEMENISIQKIRMHFGPDVTDKKNSEIFLKQNKRIVSGPRIEHGRWVVEKQRRHWNAVTFLHDFLVKMKKETKQPLKKSLPKAHILEKKQLMKSYRENREFAEFLTKYLGGKEEFLYY